MSNIGTLTVNGVEFSVDLPDEIIKGIEENFEKGQLVELNYWKSKGVAKSLALAMSEKDRPASIKQLNYAEWIARELDIELPADIRQSKCCRKFIDENVEAFTQLQDHKKALKYILSKATRVKRLIMARDLVDAGESLEAVAEKMGIKGVDTIEGYLAELMAWELAASQTEEYKVVMGMIAEEDSGVNVREKYLPYR